MARLPTKKPTSCCFTSALPRSRSSCLIAIAIGWREALVTLVVIPTTILLTLFAANLMGYTINRVSLFALIFSIGILVDDAIVVVENIARHWAMRDGRPRLQATIEAVAEVGNPTVVATLTVVAALLPMLFVSGLMGPYMAPIPANASAAMLFSFFVAMVVAPWLMLRLAPKEGAAVAAHAAHDEGVLGRIYRRFATPIVRSKRSAWIFLIGVGVATLLSMTLFATKSVTVKLLPFDNKSEIAVVVDLPEGASLEDTERVLFAAADIARGLPEITSVQSYAGTPAPFNFNGLVRHYYLRERPELGELQVNLAARGESQAGEPRHRARSAAATQGRQRSRRHQHQGRRGAARAAGAGDTAGRNLRTRCGHAPRGHRRTQEGLRRSAVHRRYRRFDRRETAAAAAVDRPGSAGVFRRRAARRLRYHPDAVRRRAGRLFPPRRRPQSDRDRGQAAEAGSRLERGAGLDAGARQHASRQQDGCRTGSARQGRPSRRARRPSSGATAASPTW